MAEVLVFGGSGYSGLELLRLLPGHPGVHVVGASSDRFAGEAIAAHVPGYRGSSSFLAHGLLMERAEKGRIAFLATPAETSHDLAPKLLDAGVSVIDLSGAFRLPPKELLDWYGIAHKRPELLAKTAYGLPELFKNADGAPRPALIANPGCYATAAILALAPIVAAGLGDPGATIMIDGKSGTTGAGRKVEEGFMFSEVADTIRPYRLGKHQHTPEIELALRTAGQRQVRVSFTAHLVPMRRGLLVSAYVPARAGVPQAWIDEAFAKAYVNSPFIRVLSRPPHPGPVAYTNFCDVNASLDPRTGTIMAFGALDNLVKGAAGQAIQNMNRLLGIDETTGLIPGGAWA